MTKPRSLDHTGTTTPAERPAAVYSASIPLTPPQLAWLEQQRKRVAEAFARFIAPK